MSNAIPSTPIPDETVNEAQNIPYLGDVDHGVKRPDYQKYNSELVAEEQPIIADDEPAQPLPVLVTNVEPRVLPRWRSNQTTVTTTVRQIVGYGESRKRIKIAHCGTDGIVWIGESILSATPHSGFPLLPYTSAGDSAIELNTSQEVYAQYAPYQQMLFSAAPFGDLTSYAPTNVTLTDEGAYLRATLTDATATSFTQHYTFPWISTVNDTDDVTISCYVRSSDLQPVYMVGYCCDDNNNVLGQLTSSPVSSGSTYWKYSNFTNTLVPGTTKLQLILGINGTAPRAIGDTFDVTKLVVNTGDTVLQYGTDNTTCDVSILEEYTVTP